MSEKKEEKGNFINLLAGEPISSEVGFCEVCHNKAEVRVFYKRKKDNLGKLSKHNADQVIRKILESGIDTRISCRNCFVSSPSLEGFAPVLCDTSVDSLGIGVRGPAPPYHSPKKETPEYKSYCERRARDEGKWYQEAKRL